MPQLCSLLTTKTMIMRNICVFITFIFFKISTEYSLNRYNHVRSSLFLTLFEITYDKKRSKNQTLAPCF